EDTYAESGHYTPRLFPAAIDTTTTQVRSWVAGMGNGTPPDKANLGGNDTLGTIDSFGIPGNWMIRADGQTFVPCAATNTPTNTPSNTAVPTNTRTNTPTNTPTNTRTNTPVPNTPTVTNTPGTCDSCLTIVANSVIVSCNVDGTVHWTATVHNPGNCTVN